MKSFKEVFKERLTVNVKKEGKSQLQLIAVYLGAFAFVGLLIYLFYSAAHQPDTARRSAMMMLTLEGILAVALVVLALGTTLLVSLVEAYKESLKARRGYGKDRWRINRYGSATAVIMALMVLLATALGDQVRVENLRQAETEDDWGTIDWETLTDLDQGDVLTDSDVEWNPSELDPTPGYKDDSANNDIRGVNPGETEKPCSPTQKPGPEIDRIEGLKDYYDPAVSPQPEPVLPDGSK